MIKSHPNCEQIAINVNKYTILAVATMMNQMKAGLGNEWTKYCYPRNDYKIYQNKNGFVVILSPTKLGAHAIVTEKVIDHSNIDFIDFGELQCDGTEDKADKAIRKIRRIARPCRHNQGIVFNIDVDDPNWNGEINEISDDAFEHTCLQIEKQIGFLVLEYFNGKNEDQKRRSS